MPDKEGAEEKTTKSVVNKKQKQMMGEEGYDIARDMGRVRPSKDKKGATSYPPSDEVKKTQKVNKGPSALERVKKKYKGQIMDVKKEELDLTKVAEAFGGFIIEKKDKQFKQGKLFKFKSGAKGEIASGSPEMGGESEKFVKGKKKKFNILTDPDPEADSVTFKASTDKKALASIGQQELKDKIKDDGDKPKVTFGQGQEPKKRAPRKGVDYFFDPKKAKAERERTVAKRKEYEIDDKGNVTDAGVEKFARKSLSRKQQASGSNVPIELSKSDLDTAREKLVGGKEVKDSKGNVVGTTTGKYGGRMAKQMSPKNLQKLRSKLKADSFIGDKPPETEQKPPDNQQKPEGPQLPGETNPNMDLNKGYRKKRNAIKRAQAFARRNPIGGYATVELGKGIIGKLMKVKGAVPGVVGGTVGRRSARGGGGL